MNFTLNDIKNSKVAHLNKHLICQTGKKYSAKKGKNIPVRNKSSKAKDYIELNLQYWANEKKLDLVSEFKFNENRKYRFDWAIPDLKLAIEFEGGIFQKKSGHNTATHYTKDANKYNLAQSDGWKILRFTALNYKNLIIELNKQHES